MKYIILLFFAINSQAQTLEYSAVFDLQNARHEFNMNLNPDGTFLFHNFSNHYNSSNGPQNKYGRGNWKIEKNEIEFVTSQQDVNNDFVLDLNGSKARIHPKTGALWIYRSEIFWIRGKKLPKKIK